MSISQPARPLSSESNAEAVLKLVLEKLDDIKAKEIAVIDVKTQTSLMDYMVIATGTSTQHVRSVAQYLVTEAKKAGMDILGHEGVELGEWALVDLNDVLVHIMIPATRAYYQIEKLWSVDATAVLNTPQIANATAKRELHGNQ